MKLLTPILAGILATISMFAANAARIGWNQLPIPLVLSVIIAALFYFLFWLNPFTHKTAPVIASIYSGMFMVWYAFNPILLGVILLAVTILCLRFKDMAKLTKPLAVFLAVAVAFSLGQAVFYSTKVSAIPPVALVDNSENNPNIYFIIPDRFPSIEAMQETGIDTTEFTTQLRADGFYINPNQISHDLFTPTTKDTTTTRTMRYLASVLNMGETVKLTTPYKTVLSMIKDPSIIPIAHLTGYKYILSLIHI